MSGLRLDRLVRRARSLGASQCFAVSGVWRAYPCDHAPTAVIPTGPLLVRPMGKQDISLLLVGCFTILSGDLQLKDAH